MSFTKKLEKTFDELRKHQITPLLVGHAGVGKSQFVEQYANKNGLNFVDIRLGQGSDSADVLGLGDFGVDIEGNKVSTKFMPPEILQKAASQPTLFLLDEINRANKELLQAMFQFVNKYEISLNGFKAHPGSFVVANINPATDEYDVLDFDDQAFNDRFCHIKFEPTIKDWVDYITEKGYKSHYINFIESEPSYLEPERSEFSLEVKPSRRSVERFMMIENECYDEEVLHLIAKGMVGVDAAVSYRTFKKNQDKLDGKDIIENYEKVRDLVQKYGNFENADGSIIKNGIDSIVRYLEELPEVNQKHNDNLVAFIKDIPGDLAYLTVDTINQKFVDLNSRYSDQDPELVDSGLYRWIATAYQKYGDEKAGNYCLLYNDDLLMKIHGITEEQMKSMVNGEKED